MKCLVCGMNIAPNSYSLNSYSFLEKNEKGRIINCPFCGVGEIYLDSENEIYTVENDNLDKESLKVLDHAMKLEVFNGEFYEEASKLADDEEIKQLFKDLSKIEFMHARIHKRLGGFEKLPKLHKPDYTRHKTDEMLLTEAHHREEHAILFYKKNSNRVSCDTIKNVFEALSDVEKQHNIITDRNLANEENDLYKFCFSDNDCIEFRLISEEDSITDLTKLLNKAYKILADMGLKYVATYQDDSITMKRIKSAFECYVGIYKGRIVATASLYSPRPSDVSSWYNNDFVAKFGQFAVLPELQKYGIGSKLMDILENDAQKIEGVTELALDTAETAYHLINFYKKRGYKFKETINWGMTNYDSVVLSKTL